jgi:hypothetical protein
MDTLTFEMMDADKNGQFAISRYGQMYWLQAVFSRLFFDKGRPL